MQIVAVFVSCTIRECWEDEESLGSMILDKSASSLAHIHLRITVGQAPFLRSATCFVLRKMQRCLTLLVESRLRTRLTIPGVS